MTEKEQYIIAIDFDGTIVEDSYPKIGNLIPGAREAITNLYNNGYWIIIWTCRAGIYLDDCLRFLKWKQIPFHGINESCPTNIHKHGSDTRKVYADVYIDDKSFHLTNDKFNYDFWSFISQRITELFPSKNFKNITSMRTSIKLITEEMQRVIEVEGFDSKHDAQHAIGELANAASCYAMTPELRPAELPPCHWPWIDFWKPSPSDRVRELQKAGALIAFEIERLLSKESQE